MATKASEIARSIAQKDKDYFNVIKESKEIISKSVSISKKKNKLKAVLDKLNPYK